MTTLYRLWPDFKSIYINDIYSVSWLDAAPIILILIFLIVFAFISYEIKEIEKRVDIAKKSENPAIELAKINIETPKYNSAKSFVSFWKRILPYNIKELLNKLDQVKVDGDPHPRLMFVLYGIIFLLILLSIARAIFYINRYWFTEHSPFYVLIEHIDIAGLFNGLLGVGLAIIIALIVYNDDKKERDNLNAVAKNLDKNVQFILTNYTALRLVNSFDDRLKAFEEILKIASKDKNDNEFYMMNYSADFGFLRSNNLGILRSNLAKKGNVATNISHKHREYVKHISDLRKKLLDLCGKDPQSVHLSFLDPSFNNKESKTRYQRYIERALDYAAVISWKHSLQALVDKSQLDKLLEKIDQIHNVIYVNYQHDGDTENITDPKIKQDFINLLIRENKRNIDEFIQIPEFKIDLIDRIPFQFIMTKPKEGDGNVSNQSCLITFSNIDAIGENAGVYAFQSSHGPVINNLATIYATYKGQQEDRNCSPELIRWKEFNDFFDLQPDRKVYTVLKFKPLVEETTELHNGVSLADLLASSEVEKMFLHFHEKIAVEQMPKLEYHSHKDDSGNFSIGSFNEFHFENATYFAIGLFGSGTNPLTLSEYIIEKFGNEFLKTARKIPTSTDPEIESNVLYVNGTPYTEIWKLGGSKDTGIIAKLRLTLQKQDVTVFIVGGINHYGTEIITKYFNANWQAIAKQVGKDSFVAVYDIEGEVTTQISFTML